MKRGFLNSKKVKNQPLYDNNTSSPTRTTPIASDPSSGQGAAASHQKTLSEPIVGQVLLDQAIQKNARSMEPYSVARIPSLQYTKSKEPSSTCIIRQSTCSKILNTPGYYTPLPTKAANPANAVFTKTMADMGVGLFAKRNIKFRDLIFSERPLLVFPKGWRTFGSKEPGMSEEDMIQKSNFEMEEIMRQALSTMAKEDADAYMSLSNCHPETPQLYGIAYTNSFGADIEEVNILEGKTGYGAVGKFASRINHSCTQNIWVNFDIPTFSLQVIALRDIKANEQLFHCYCQLDKPAKERQRQLEVYGFVCKCKACVNATPESDKLREEMDARIQMFVERKKQMFASPGFNLRSLDPLLKLEKDIIKEELDFRPSFVELLGVIMEGYAKLNDSAKAREYFNRAKKFK